MNKYLLSILLSSIISFSFAQTIEDQYDFLTQRWLETSGKLKTYSGLGEFCNSPEFRAETFNTLQSLHHYDSLVLDIMNDPAVELDAKQKEYKRTFKDIKKFENKYDLIAFRDFLKESCLMFRDLEKNKDELVNEVGQYSYDGQIFILETDLRKFLTHIDKKVLDIDDHLHLLHLDRVNLPNTADESSWD